MPPSSRLPLLPFDERPIERLHAPKPAELAARRHAPVVLTGCLDDWPLLQTFRRLPDTRARLDELRSAIGHRVLHWHRAPEKYVGDTVTCIARARTAVSRDPFATIADRIATAVDDPSVAAVYAPMTSLARAAPELLPQLGALPFYEASAAQPANLWVGSGRHVVPLHQDMFENFICMVAGRKRVVVLPPSVLADIYPSPLDVGSISLAWLHAPDWETFPRLRGALAEAQVALIEPGEVLFLPPCWWHYVESFDFNLMINTWVDVTRQETIDEFKTQLEDSVIGLAHTSQETREQVGAWFRARVAGDAGPSGASASVAELVAAPARAIGGYGQAMRTMAEKLYDHLVFRTEGDPFPTLPGEFERMVARLTRHRAMRLARLGGDNPMQPRRRP